MGSRFARTGVVTVMDALDGHVALDLECLDRLYLHGYLAPLQVGGQVIQFLSHRGYPVPSPACLQQIGDAFRRRVASFAEANHIPVVPLKAGDRNIEVMAPYLRAAAASGRSQVAAIGVVQEMQRVFILLKFVVGEHLDRFRGDLLHPVPRLGPVSVSRTPSRAAGLG